jgi:hypothetical protein
MNDTDPEKEPRDEEGPVDHRGEPVFPGYASLINGDLVRAAPGLARIAAAAWWRTTVWGVETSARASSRLLQSAISGEAPAELFKRTGSEVREYAKQMLDIVGPVARGRMPGVPGGQGAARSDGNAPEAVEGEQEQPAKPKPPKPPPDSKPALRAKGAELLRLSADVHYDDSGHPAYAQILDQLAPDEMRILRLLMLEGPQTSVDVRSGLPMSSTLIEPGLNMIGPQAGCRHPERVPAYLNNLHRLGLVWFSREPVEDQLAYQVLEAQPDVIAALKKAGRTGRTVRRSIRMTPFGMDFCNEVLPLDTADFEAVKPEDLPDAPTREQKRPGGAGPGGGAAPSGA